MKLNNSKLNFDISISHLCIGSNSLAFCRILNLAWISSWQKLNWKSLQPVSSFCGMSVTLNFLKIFIISQRVHWIFVIQNRVSRTNSYFIWSGTITKSKGWATYFHVQWYFLPGNNAFLSEVQSCNKCTCSHKSTSRRGLAKLFLKNDKRQIWEKTFIANFKQKNVVWKTRVCSIWVMMGEI